MLPISPADLANAIATKPGGRRIDRVQIRRYDDGREVEPE